MSSLGPGHFWRKDTGRLRRVNIGRRNSAASLVGQYAPAQERGFQHDDASDITSFTRSFSLMRPKPSEEGT